MTHKNFYFFITSSSCYIIISMIMMMMLLLSSKKVVVLEAFTFQYNNHHHHGLYHFMSNNNNNNNNNDDVSKQKPQNEFSRPIHTDIILSPRSSRRKYNQQISATTNELQNLAKRFSLSNISKLDANLILTKDDSRLSSSSKSSLNSSNTNSGCCIVVQGDVIAHVTQTCVRTNEDFDVEFEFSIYSIVRAIDSREMRQNQDIGGMSLAQIEGQLGGSGGGSGRKKKGGRKKQRSGGNIGGSLNDMNMKEIESMLQEFDIDDDIYEDENVLGPDGILDVGELVAQMFRIKLDPYPKKPGSEPVSYSISG